MELRTTLSQALKSLGVAEVVTDQALVEACLGGDERAWNALVERYKRLIFSIPVKQRIPPSDAADVFQGVCLDMLENLSTLRDTSKLKSWLITVTARKCFHWWQAQQRSAVPLAEGQAEAMIDENADLSRLTLEVEREQVIRDALEKLPPRCAVLIRHLFFDEPQMPYARIAEKIGVSTNTIGSTRERCLEKLRAILTESGIALE